MYIEPKKFFIGLREHIYPNFSVARSVFTMLADNRTTYFQVILLFLSGRGVYCKAHRPMPNDFRETQCLKLVIWVKNVPTTSKKNTTTW